MAASSMPLAYNVRQERFTQKLGKAGRVSALLNTNYEIAQIANIRDVPALVCGDVIDTSAPSGSQRCIWLEPPTNHEDVLAPIMG
ncbi:MAG: hypothetical protein M3Z14_00365 [Candidatus Eremiobacteraeota bacterium]|nr:hypothetical protein [Candidatus Eremiobacteraeota bacterium]